MKKLIFVLVLMFFKTSLGQELYNHRFKGIVLDAHSKTAIPFVHFTYSNSKGFTSNEKGVFHFVDTLERIHVKMSYGLVLKFEL